MSTESVEHRPEDVLDEAVNQGNLAFAVAAFGTSEGQSWAYAAGHRDANKRHSANPDNIVQIASMTKLVTSTAALQLVERGLPCPGRACRCLSCRVGEAARADWFRCER
jgi:CubicO group peptidase (beta-lactamase class C family)